MAIFSRSGMTGALIASAGLALGLTMPVLAKHAKVADPGQSGQVAQDSAGGQQGQETRAQILEDAMEICRLVVDNRRKVVEVLDGGGWSSDINYDIGNAPFYKEISAQKAYGGVGGAEVWGFIEDYPGYQMGYCSLTVDSPEGVFDLSPVDGVEGLVGELIVEGDQSYGAWRSETVNDEMATVFVHAYQNADTFLYQISAVRKLER